MSKNDSRRTRKQSDSQRCKNHENGYNIHHKSEQNTREIIGFAGKLPNYLLKVITVNSYLCTVKMLPVQSEFSSAFVYDAES